MKTAYLALLVLAAASSAHAAPRSEMVTEGYRMSCAQRQALNKIAPHNRPRVVAFQSRGKVPPNIVAKTAPITSCAVAVS